MNDQKKTLKPLSVASARTQDELSDFITGAETERLSRGEFPWEAPHVSKSNIRVMNLRLPEPLKLRLSFIAQNTHYSQHGFLMHHIEKLIKEQTDLLIAMGHKPDDEE